ncbi:MAG: RimK family alpha-L-glutamate ligase, partial [Myxococcaceae bacterium]|nr:RimK family alpha-L-glutamate ligase [Myxococcaceae bacterium]
VVVLSRTGRVPSTRRLVEAARARGHQVRVIDPATLQLQLGPGRARLVRAWKRLKTPDLVVPRFGPPAAPFALPMVEQFAAQGAVVLNGERAIAVSRHPMRCLLRMTTDGVPVPRTVLARDARALKGLVPRVGGLPVLVKLVEVSEAPRVMLCESMQTLESAVEAVLGLGHDVMMQESVRPGQQEVRLLVVGAKVVAAVARVMRPGRAGRNLGQPERIEPTRADEAVVSLAQRAAKSCGLEVCAVDVRRGRRALVTAVHAAPNLLEFEPVDVADAIIAHGERLVAEQTVQRRRGT